jgi:signal transduction histidine kinase
MTVPAHLAAVSSYLRDQAPVVYLEFDQQGVVRAANRFSVDMLGPDVVGRPFCDVFFDARGTLTLKALAVDPSQIHRLDVSLPTRLPQTIHCSFYATGDRILALGHVDISELQSLQRQFIELNNELNVLTRQLQKANAELERLNAMKNRFVGFAAHDLRKPAGIIQNYAEFLIEEANDRLTEDQRSFLNVIHERAEAMGRLISELLDIAVIESGRNHAELEMAELKPIIDTARAAVAQAAEARGVGISVEIELGLEPILLDRLKIEQVMTNLLSNAVEHTRAGSDVRIWVRRTGDHVAVSVADNGPGLSAAAKAGLFQPFGGGPKQPQGGRDSHGLGLAIAKYMIDAHQGRIWADSVAGEGATFTFVLPASGPRPSGG